VAAASLGLASIFVRQLDDAGLSPASLAFFRYAFTAMVLLPFVNLSPRLRLSTLWGLLGGAVLGIGWVSYAHTLSRIDLGTNGVAYMTFPIFSLAASRVVFGRPIDRRALAGAALVVAAATFALQPGSAPGITPVLLLAPAAFGFSISILTERLGPLDPFERLSAVALGASAGLAPVVLSLPAGEVLPSTLPNWGWLIGLGVVCGLVPMWIYGAAAPRVGGARTSAAGAIELPTMFVVGLVVFGEEIRFEHVVAGALIMMSIIITPVVSPCAKADRIEHRSPTLDALVVGQVRDSPHRLADHLDRSDGDPTTVDWPI